MQKVTFFNNRFALILVAILTVSNVYSRRVMNGGKVGGTNPTPAAGCGAAVDKATLELNNVRTRIEGTGGSMWQDRPNSIADYEIPKRGSDDDPKYTSIYAGALWMGGQDVNGQLKVAAVTFRASGNDFWPGPLNTSTAEIDAATCSVFDQSFGISRAMVDQFNAWYLCYEDPLCDEVVEYPGYSIPDEIKDYPAKGNQVKKGNATYFINENLAPFYDRDGDDFYDPTAGDYPKYDLLGDIDCRVTRDVRLFGDTTIWFVFNDKGNVHSESQGPSIGMEIRGQAFAFATNDEINNMTFYNYEMINRSTFTLSETYFGQWVDADLGGSTDDYVGCDAQRGLGYCYNGDALDEGGNGIEGYGLVPPAVGVDFFEGPYADNDGIDNPLTQIVQDALDSNGIPYPGLGIGYGDGIVDNERYGMRKFVYYSIGGGQFSGDGDPGSALDYYNYLRGRWRFGGAQMVWGGNGNAASSGGTVVADLLFPGDSDPLFWSTQGVSATPSNWSEFNEGNPAGDRRFLESAGPFTLEPGAVNDLTVGVVWTKAASGDNWSSVQSLRVADDKAQALFDNCFKLVDGPDAPDLNFQELDKELILYLTNRKASNNYNETFNEKNPFIAIPDTLDGVYLTSEEKDSLKFYSFQGYKIYQVKNGLITVGELDDPSKAILIAQVDIKDDVKDIINYEEQEFTVGGGQAPVILSVPKQMVQAENAGIRHSFRITKDAFASGDGRLVNHKTYYFMAIAYAHNEYKKFDPDYPLEGGNMLPYLASRKMAGGQGITSFAAIPHNPSPENGGTLANSAYGDMPEITRKEGQGNGGNILELTDETEATIVANHFSNDLVYESGYGPIQVKVIDPLNVQAGVYTVQFKDTITPGNLNDASWTLHLPNGVDKVDSDQLIEVENEQLILEHGLSITIAQSDKPGVNVELGNGVLSSEIEYADPSLRWLGGFSDQEGENDGNWILAGTSNFDVDGVISDYNDRTGTTGDYIDPEQYFEGLVNGTWAPYALVNYINPASTVQQDALGANYLNGKGVKDNKIGEIPSVDIVFTSDQSKWTRSMVLEARNDVLLAEGGAAHMELRNSPSVDKNGNPDGALDGNGQPMIGMGWFPGYAINVETGERLNMAFAEDSWLAGENGRDMKWNPTSTLETGVPDFPGGPLPLIMGGKHYVYVFRKFDHTNPAYDFPAYDSCSKFYPIMNSANVVSKHYVWTSCAWAGIPMLEPGHSLFETDAKVKLRVEKPYESFYTDSINNELPYYQFDMTGMEVELGNASAMDSALAMINVVPNPYYAYSEYESSQLDKRIKITNLPQECTISIYNINGTLMRRFQKGDPKTSLDWDLNNHVNIPIASGVYLIHVKVPDVGERTLKWYGVMKPTDLNGF